MSNFDDLYDDSLDRHTYRTLQPKDFENWLDGLADEYISLRISSDLELVPVSVKGIQVLDTEALEDLLKSSVVPEPKQGKMSITRSDLSEIASYFILEDEYSTKIGFKLIRDRELVDLPGRGIDVIGVESNSNEQLNLVLTEVKFSDENKNPPQVVQPGADSLQKQHQAHLNEKDKTFAKLMDCARKITDLELRSLYFSAAILFREEKWDSLDLTYCSVLVRPEAKYDEKDFGCFKDKPENFNPGLIRFLILRLPGEMNEILDTWHKLISEKTDAPTGVEV